MDPAEVQQQQTEFSQAGSTTASAQEQDRGLFGPIYYKIMTMSHVTGKIVQSVKRCLWSGPDQNLAQQITALAADVGWSEGDLGAAYPAIRDGTGVDDDALPPMELVIKPACVMTKRGLMAFVDARNWTNTGRDADHPLHVAGKSISFVKLPD